MTTVTTAPIDQGVDRGARFRQVGPNIPARKELVVFGPETDADTHVQANNSGLRDAAAFDCLSNLRSLGAPPDATTAT